MPNDVSMNKHTTKTLVKSQKIAMKKLLVFGRNEKTRGMYLNAKSEDTTKSLKVIGREMMNGDNKRL
jgi:hypothetical protein